MKRFGCRKVAGLIYPDAVALDLVGPLEVFNYANVLAREELQRDDVGYEIDIFSQHTGPVSTMSTLCLHANKSFDEHLEDYDMILVPGMKFGSREFVQQGVLPWLRDNGNKVNRLVSVCSGALVLAYAGLLSGKEVTTHWNHGEIIRSEFPDIKVNDSQIYCCSDNVYSSAGVSSGIDLALSIVEEDHGRAMALKIAKRMVVFLKRPGDQNQFSDLLHSQTQAKRFSELLDWIEQHLKQKITVTLLAEKSAMSVRNFTRSFTADVGYSPMNYILLRRLEWARVLLEETQQSLSSVAKDSGFASLNSFSKAFKEAFHIPPGEYRKRFQ